MDVQAVSIQQAKELITAGVDRVMSKVQDLTFQLNQLSPVSTSIRVGRAVDIVPIILLLYLKWHMDLLHLISCTIVRGTNGPFQNLWNSHTVIMEVSRVLDDLTQTISGQSFVMHGSRGGGNYPIQVPCSLPLRLGQKIKILAVLKEFKANFMMYHATISFSDLSDRLQTRWRPRIASLGLFVDQAVSEFSGSDVRVYKLIWRRIAIWIEGTAQYTVEAEFIQQQDDSPLALQLEQLYHTAIPITKLLRLLLNKLSKHTNSDLHPVERMSNELQLKLLTSIQLVASHLHGLVHTIDVDDPAPPRVMLDPLDSLTSAVAVTLETITDFLCQDSSPPGDRLSNERCKRWYESWSKLFNKATQTFSRTSNQRT
ncbi:hypothetical protein MJO28_006069 [Puccinia striiformis f. sp. tritici]|uniref:Uncharacterized protein n=2 Tax=Puccinia striiformis TaxID=27350 RepID=A0A2S4VP66_9BASI|nr:hypothetical protein Pst134EB_012272 [Puccinia striiformis f. sp. tritici]KAI7953522.1 hypothetical protein MJO28_006069 [Puccinia striiformis f. sp. tritici]KAI7957866.1 hypothetical protein MJO29_006083 [Puccinia striiformis f. sp. tritici]KAI9604907.1 hypothetical protein H4Q26_002877 [Puccinia striiformis f. sp. tritici PST-130]POW11357.1 hypothetical protein PSTT_05330 [Puccinia striiformis]